MCEGLKEDGSCNERKKLGVALFSRTRSERELYYQLLDMLRALATDLKRTQFQFRNVSPLHSFQHPRNTAAVSWQGEDLGWLCCLHPAVLQKLDKKAAVVCAQLDMDAFAAIPAADVAYEEPSKFPGMDMDLSLLLPEGMTFSQMEPAWADLPKSLLTGVSLIDIFQQKGQRSVTLRFSFSSKERTLSKEEIQPLVDGIVERLSQAGAVLRS